MKSIYCILDNVNHLMYKPDRHANIAFEAE